MQFINSHLLMSQDLSRKQLEEFANRNYLFAIMDSCDCDAIHTKVKQLGEDRAVSLFKGSAQEDYWEVAPYLAQVDPEFLLWAHQHIWMDYWGIFVFSKAPIRALYEHLRKFLIVMLPDQRPSYFRFYDPRVLSKFLRTFTPDELNVFYGPVRAYGIPSRTDLICRAFLLK